MDYLKRGKGLLQTTGMEESRTVDIIIVQGTGECSINCVKVKLDYGNGDCL